MYKSALKSVSLLVAWMLFFIHTNAQLPVYKNYTVEQGLPSSEVYSIKQDSKGFLWFCTDAGVSRFDGNAFKTFTITEGLPDNTILNVYEDSKARIWFHSFSGKLTYYDGSKICAFPLSIATVDSLKGSFLKAIYVDDQDNIWLWARSIYVIDAQTKKVHRTNYVQGLPRKFINKRMIDAVTCMSGNSFRSGIAKHVNFFQKIFELQDWSAGKKVYMVARPDGHWLLARQKKLVELDAEGGVLWEKEFSNDIICLYQDRAYNVWIGLWKNGVQYFSKGNIKKASINYFPSKSITSVLEDKEKGFWFGTLQSGVYYMPNYKIASLNDKQGLSDNKVNCIVGRNGEEVFVGMEDGTLQRIHKGNRGYIYEQISTSEVKYKGGRSTPHYSLYLDKGENLFYSDGYSFIKKDKWGNILRKLENVPDVKCIYPFGDDIYLGTSDNLFKLNKDWKKSKVDQERVEAMVHFKDTFWLGNLDGLNYLDGQTIVPYKRKEKVFRFRIKDLKKYSNDYLLIATKGNGLLFYNGGDNVIRLGEEEGLSSDICNSIFLDEQNSIWVCTNNGLDKIVVQDLRTKKFKIKRYNQSTGLLSNEVSQMYKSGDAIWVATRLGLSHFNESDITSNNTAPPVFITSVSVNGTQLRSDSSTTLAYNQNNVEVTYVGIAYRNAQTILYRYKTIGLDTFWKYTSATSVRFTTLPPGSYRFLISAQNNEGIWSSNPASYSFVIKPAFWETIWFWVISTLAIVIVVFWIVRRRIKGTLLRTKEQLETKRKMAEYELRALRAQMNPHFIFNTLNAIQDYYNKHRNAEGNIYLAKFSKLIRRILDNSELSKITIEDEIETLRLYLELETMRLEEKAIAYTISVDPEIEANFCKIPSMLVQPYVENAIWHGLTLKDGECRLSIEFRLHTDDQLLCIVEDNGIGRTAAAAVRSSKELYHQSKGTVITMYRIEQLNQSINSNLSVDIIDKWQSTGEPAGTRVELYIPFE